MCLWSFKKIAFTIFHNKHFFSSYTYVHACAFSVALLLSIGIAGHEIPLDPALLITSGPFDFKLFRSSIYDIMKPDRLSDMFANMFNQLVSSISDSKKKINIETSNTINKSDNNDTHRTQPKGVYWESQKTRAEDFYDLFYKEDDTTVGSEQLDNDGSNGVEAFDVETHFNYEEFKTMFGTPAELPNIDGNKKVYGSLKKITTSSHSIISAIIRWYRICVYFCYLFVFFLINIYIYTFKLSQFIGVLVTTCECSKLGITSKLITKIAAEFAHFIFCMFWFCYPFKWCSFKL